LEVFLRCGDGPFWQVLYHFLPSSIQVKAPLKGIRMMMIASDLRKKVEVDFGSDDIGEVAAPGRKKLPLVVAAKQSPLPQDLERPAESMVLSSTCKPDIYLHPFAAYVRNSVNGQP
jgi:hypothetical protein